LIKLVIIQNYSLKECEKMRKTNDKKKAAELFSSTAKIRDVS